VIGPSLAHKQHRVSAHIQDFLVCLTPDTLEPFTIRRRSEPSIDMGCVPFHA